MPSNSTPRGVVVRHRRRCSTPERGASCSCHPAIQAWVWSARDGKKLWKTFRRVSEARAWQADARRALNRGELRAPTKLTLREAAREWLELAEKGVVRTRSGQAYKPSTLRRYRGALILHVLPDLGGAR